MEPATKRCCPESSRSEPEQCSLLQPYAYAKLNDRPLVTRVLEVFSADLRSEPLRGHLWEVQLSSQRATRSNETENASGIFEALLYTWGSEGKTGGIEIDDRYLAIGASRDAALRQFRLQGLNRRLRVDAICINQEDDEERTAQVAIMALIYGSARRTLSWLGEDSGQA